MARLRQVGTAMAVIGLLHFPSRIVTRSESARRHLHRYVSRLMLNATRRAKRG